MKTRFLPLAAAFYALLSQNTLAMTRYVNVNGPNPVSPYLTWATAATNIQNAINAASSGDLILVTNGIYQYGISYEYGQDRVNISRAVTVQSVNGPAVTIIQGTWDTATNGPNAVRCVYLMDHATLSGFTLTNGATGTGEYGGGVRCTSTNCVITNCVITGNSAYNLGGGAYYGTLINCMVSGNIATSFSDSGAGGGAAYSALINCLVTKNFAGYTGGGAAWCTLINCTVVSNSAAAYDGSILNGTLLNTIVYYNHSYYSNADDSNPLTVTNCLITCNTAWPSGQGGGIYGGTIINSTLTNNTAGYGGAGAAVNMIGCLIVSNSAPYSPPEGYGGGLYLGTASNCTFTLNGWGYGITGGAAAQSTLYNCTVNTNLATYGGAGAYLSVLYNCTLTGNKCSSTGGCGFNSTNYNCVFANNVGTYGGAMYGGVSFNCILSNNTATYGGGGSHSSTLNNCLLVANVVGNGSGGGATSGTLNNCTIVSNTATVGGGGVDGGALNNCIVYDNTAGSSSAGNNYDGANLNYCCTTPLPTNGVGNITNDPAFVDLANGNFRLQTNSPCINSGNNSYVKNSTDLDGNPHISGGTADIGAFEVQSPASMISYAWLLQYGLPTDGTADSLDSDGDGMSNYAEWRCGTNPTNAASFLQMSSAIPASDFSSATITWQSVSGINYFVQRRGDLGAQPPFSTIQSNILGQAGTTSYLDTNAVGPGPYFYRVGVR